MIRCSLGTGRVLGLKKVKVDALPTTAYLMVGDRCSFNCAFCAQARESGARADMLSRVTWPNIKGEELLQGLQTKEARQTLQRICFQVVQDHEALKETKEWIKEIQKHSETPICVSAGPKSLEEIEELLNQGVDHVSIALDAATPDVYVKMKDGSWKARYDLLKAATKRFPGHVATHLIVGLGETDEEIITLIQDLYDLGITVALFAFTPVKGTRMESVPQPELKHYRRIQSAHFLIRKGLARSEQFDYKQGKLTSFGLTQSALKEMLGDGEAFRTSGCTGCNRPYYNEMPGQKLYNYPRPLTPEEVVEEWQELCSQILFAELNNSAAAAGGDYQ